MNVFFSFEEIARELGISKREVEYFIEMEWVLPAEPETSQLDQQDRARIRLICELRDQMGVNDEAIPLVLHLMDQLHGLMDEIEILRQKMLSEI